MPKAWIDQNAVIAKLADFFSVNRKHVTLFGSTVNQTFEAFVFAAVTSWYESKGWKVEFRHPVKPKQQNGDGPGKLRLKFSTRGKPGNYSYVVCRKRSDEVHLRHQLRVATRYHDDETWPPANVCLNVAVIKPTDLSFYSTNDHVPNNRLVTFGEAKHMSAFAELIANFIGLVHEMQPQRLKKYKFAKNGATHVPPFLYVSGTLYQTAQGLLKTIERRQFDLDVFHRTKELAAKFKLPNSDGKQQPGLANPKKAQVDSKQDALDVPF